EDGCVQLESEPAAGVVTNLFKAGMIGMMTAGAGDLSSFPNVNYGVVYMASFDQGGSHETIAGPDNWVIFDNGTERVNAAWDFLKFMVSPDQVLQDSIDTGHLPTRASVEKMSGFSAFDK